jgi:hypothetical protein
VAIHQPAYLPWLGYFERMARVDALIILDTVQFEKNSFDNRNRIRDKKAAQWLTVPVKTKGRFGENGWQRLEINHSTRWQEKQLRSLDQCYGKAAHWEPLRTILDEAFARDDSRLLDLNLFLIKRLTEMLGVGTPLLMASDYHPKFAKSELVLELLQAVNADQYLSGTQGRDYLDTAEFERRGFVVSFQDYEHPEYRQAYPGFIPYLSVIDLYANHGEDSLDILLGGGKN